MADFLLVHDAGQGSWSWGRVWGHLTAPVEHPPRLYAGTSVGKVVALDLPGHGSRIAENTPGLTLEHFVGEVVSEIQSRGLHDLILACQGLAAPIVLQAAAKLDEPPRRIVLFAGIIPQEGKSSLDTLPRRSRLGFRMMVALSRVAKRDVRLPKAVITNFYCNDMDSFDVVQILGRFGPLPLELLRTRVYLGELVRNLPVTYVPLWRDRLIPTNLQQAMAARLGAIEIAPELDSCHQATIERPKQVADILLRYA